MYQKKSVQLPMLWAVVAFLSCASIFAAQSQGQRSQRQRPERQDKILSGTGLAGLGDAATIEGKCPSSDGVVAITNGVETTIKSPRNTGDCDFTLKCRDKDKKTVGKPATIPKGGMLHSFSCGKDAVDIGMDCGGDSGACKITYTDR